MVILIGGSSHVGKTLVSQVLMEKLKYPYVSLDHLKMGFIRTKMTDLTVNDDLKIRYWMWPFVAEMIKTAVENNQNMIIEGCYIPGNWAESFDEHYLEHIRCSFIVMSREYIDQNFDSIKDYANVIEKRLDDHPDKNRLIMCSENFKKECSEYGINCIEIDKKFDVQDIVSRIESIL